jgi:hypothetical protein
MFNVYTGVKFISLDPGWKGMSTRLLIDTPPGKARSDRPGARTAFWDTMGGKRLIQGGLIALLWVTTTGISVNLGTISSSFRDPDVKDFVRSSRDQLRLKITFFDSDVEMRVLQSLHNKSTGDDGFKVLVESPVMFEAIRPFLLSLKSEPEIMPFSKYLAHRPPAYFETCAIEPPKYSTLPGFSFQLSSLFSDDSGIKDLRLTVSDPVSIANAREELRNSRLDPSQADAVVDALTREVAMIQG